MKSENLLMFFFFKQKTAYERRISDWSSDVCSSDLAARRMATSAGRAGAARVSGRLRAGPALGAPLLQERTAKLGNTKTTGRRLPTRRRLNCANQRSEERRVGKECVSLCRSWLSQCN